MTTLAAHRISTLQWLRAEVAVAVGLEPDHEGADTIGWAQQLHDMRLADAQRVVSRADVTATAIIPPARPALALTSVAYQLVNDEHLGVLPIGPLVPAYIHDALAGGAR